MNATQRTLEYLKWPRILAELQRHASTDMGKDAARNLKFLPRPEDIRTEQARVSALKAVLEEGRAPDFGSICDVGSLLHRAQKEGTLSAAELLVMGDCLAGIGRLVSFLGANSRTLDPLASIRNGLNDQRGTAHEIAVALDRDGKIRDDASRSLKELRRSVFDAHQAITSRIDEFLRAPQVEEVLQERYYTLREDRYVLPIRSERRSQVDGIVHAVSQSGATVFVEPQFLVSLNNRLKLLQEEVKREEFSILSDLTRLVAEGADLTRRSLEAAAAFDLIAAKALLSVRLKGHPAVLTSGQRIALRLVRSPILLFQNQEVVANDLDVGEQGRIEVVANDIVVGEQGRILVVSGPNAGGKSVALSALGQCVLMFHAGLHVPAGPDSEIPFLDGLHALPGDLEDVERQLSTFSGHLQELNRVVAAAGKGHLVLIDEITVGTEPVQGAALGAGYLISLADLGCLAVVATHYEQLKALAMSDPRFENASMGMDWETLTPTYRLVRGTPGSSRTFEIARRFGVPGAVVSMAQSFFEGKSGSLLEDALRRLADKEAEIAREAEELRAAVQEARNLARRRTLALESLGQQAGRIIARKVKEGISGVEDALRTVAAIVARLQKETAPTHAGHAGSREETAPTHAGHAGSREETARSHAVLAASRDELEGIGRELERKARELQSEEEVERLAPGPRSAIVPGAEVFVRKYGRKAIVLSVQESEGVAELKMGPMKMREALSGLVPISAAQSPARRGWAASSAPPSLPAGSGWTASAAPPSLAAVRLDLRGLDVQDALDRVAKALDDLLVSSSGSLVIVHGHGTGRLKAAVRSMLKETAYPVVCRAGKRDEGGDGVTLVTPA